jgi:hypothetical protein
MNDKGKISPANGADLQLAFDVGHSSKSKRSKKNSTILNTLTQQFSLACDLTKAIYKPKMTFYTGLKSSMIIFACTFWKSGLRYGRCAMLGAGLSSTGPIRFKRPASNLNDDEISRLLCLDSKGGDESHRQFIYEYC